MTDSPIHRPAIPGIFALDKPYEMSSARAVGIVKHWARAVTGDRRVKVGHGGTLDPLATGVLVIAVGREHTRRLEEVVAAEKEYEATVTLGWSSTTDDEEGEKTKVRGPIPSLSDVRHACDHLTGDIIQTPPVYSALKTAGVPAYRRARRGEDVTMAPRPVTVHAIDILAYVYPDVRLRVRCGKGTYIRAIARDLGGMLGSAGYLAALRRTRVGGFTRADAYRITDVIMQDAPTHD